MIAVVHDDLRPPVSLLLLSSGYLTWTKGSSMPPSFFCIAHNWNDAQGPVSNLYIGFTQFLSAWIANSYTLFGKE
jgi:hypothetical protein